jgi:hypothetical protein
MRYSTLAAFVVLLSSAAAMEISLGSRGGDWSGDSSPSYSSDSSSNSGNSYSASDSSSQEGNSYSGGDSWSKGSESEGYSKSVDSNKSEGSTKTHEIYSHSSKTGESYSKVTHASKAYSDKKNSTKTKTGTHEVWSTHSVYKTKLGSGSNVGFPK